MMRRLAFTTALSILCFTVSAGEAAPDQGSPPQSDANHWPAVRRRQGGDDNNNQALPHWSRTSDPRERPLRLCQRYRAPEQLDPNL